MGELQIAYQFQSMHSVKSWEEALYKATSQLIHEKIVSANYLKDIVEEINKSGSYMALSHDTVVFHARPSEYVFKEFISYMTLEEPIHYFDKVIHHVFVFGARTEDFHLALLSKISTFLTAVRSDEALLTLPNIKAWFNA